MKLSLLTVQRQMHKLRKFGYISAKTNGRALDIHILRWKTPKVKNIAINLDGQTTTTL